MPIESADTSINQIASGLKYIAKNLYSNINLDYGGGKYDRGTIYLKDFNIENFIYDPFNRSEKHNIEILEYIENLNKPLLLLYAMFLM